VPLSGELLALHEREDDYRGDPDLVRPYIEDREVHMIVAAEKMGTSTSLEKVVDRLPDSARAAILTNRQIKYGDPLPYRTSASGITLDKIKRLITDNEVVNYAILPSGEAFATVPESYPKLHNFIHMMPNGVHQMQHAGFKNETLTYMFMAARAWEAQMTQRRFAGQQKTKMENNVVSFAYGIDHAKELNFVENRIGQQDRTVSSIINVTVGGTSGYDTDKAVETLHELLAIAKDLAVRSK
jgi:hypothetical protein